MSLDVLLLKCAGTKPPSKGFHFIEQAFFVKQMFSSYVYIRVGAYLF